MKRRILVIGGGASGMIAAIFAARQNAEVTILEHREVLGKKLLATGNGKCNLTNLNIDGSCYFSNRPDFPMQVINAFDVSATLEFFESIGIYPKNKNGYIYPRSEQASSVRELLIDQLKAEKVRVILNCHVKGVNQDQHKHFMIQTNQGMFKGEALILAAGSKAAPKTGSDGSGYSLAELLGHTVISPLPALVQLRCFEKHYRQLAGVRTEANVKLLVNGEQKAQSAGEVQLTDYGISGIPTFQISRFAAIGLEQQKEVVAEIDFWPEVPYDQVWEYLAQRLKLNQEALCQQLLPGIFNKKLAAVLLKLAGISCHDKVAGVSQSKWQQLLKEIKCYRTRIVTVNSYEQAQVCCGGIDTGELNAVTMASRLVENLYFAGEIIDVDAICGGYNLQFAWSSGSIAGTHAGKGSL